MAANKVIERAGTLQFTVPPSSTVVITSGDPLLVGELPVVANESNNDATRPQYNNQLSVDAEGAFNLSVVGKSTLSPAVNKAVLPGDPVYADGGSKDATTNVTTGITLDANSGGVLFGHALDGVTAGATATIRVLLARI